MSNSLLKQSRLWGQLGNVGHCMSSLEQGKQWEVWFTCAA